MAVPGISIPRTATEPSLAAARTTSVHPSEKREEMPAARTKVRLLFVAMIVLGALVGGALSGVISESTASAPASTALPAALTDSAANAATLGIGGRDTAGVVQKLELALQSDRSPELLTRLGLAYQLRWRETGDASYLPRSETALRQALAVARDDPGATLGLGSLALIRHDFRGALVLGRRAVSLAPYAPSSYGVAGDALLELGRYREAFATFDRMVAIKPTLSGYARIAYARELVGNRAGALGAMRLALESAGGVPEPTAWTLVEIAKLQLGEGRFQEAERSLRQALRVFPGYPFAGETLARVYAAEGKTADAIAEARIASAAIPLPGTVALLGNLLERRGDMRGARRQFATVGAIDRLLAAGGIKVDLDTALYRADRGIAPRRTVALALAARRDRPSITGDDVLGWALARAGECRRAEAVLDRALRLGTRDALMFFHRGYAAGCAGRLTAKQAWYRRALALNPSFSVQWSAVARRALS